MSPLCCSRVLTLLAATLMVVAPAAGQSVDGLRIGLQAFPEATLSPGLQAVSSLSIQNTGPRPRTVWVGYSLQSPSGDWTDVPATEIDLAADEHQVVEKIWAIPADAVVGDYRVVLAVWSAQPGEPNAERLASFDRPNAFRIVDDPQPHLLPTGWTAADHRLGRGRLRPELVTATGDGFRLQLPAGSCDGAEIRTVEPVGYGEYTVRLRTPLAPGSLSAVFLYEDVSESEGNDEIDIEIFNDGSFRALLTVWLDGEQIGAEEILLPFDPAAAFHDYSIRWSDSAVHFLADGEPLGVWRGEIPTSRMKFMVNAWWPRWLDCVQPAESRTLQIERIVLTPTG